jgi:hypothetical protein
VAIAILYSTTFEFQRDRQIWSFDQEVGVLVLVYVKGINFEGKYSNCFCCFHILALKSENFLILH